jgi:hypothetical protein
MENDKDLTVFRDYAGQWWECRARVTIGGFVSPEDGPEVVQKGLSLLQQMSEALELKAGDEILVLRPRRDLCEDS